MEIGFGILTSLATHAPVLVVWLVGIILALGSLERQPRVARLVLISLVIFVLQAVIFTPLATWLPLVLHSRGASAGQMGVYFAALGFLNSLIAAVAWALLLVAVFRRINATG